ncbi:MAG: YqcC family protein [Crocinitomicaceae bacterium]|nr:YqcC family protein [Crocinitomicaceae bacterium]
MTEKDQSVLTHLDAIEAEMKRIGFWNPEVTELNVNHYLEAPTFELWLQCTLIPNARKAAQTGEYPANSEVGQMAFRQYDYMSPIPEAAQLLQMLYEFDKLVMS